MRVRTDLIILTVSKLAACASAWLGGFRAVSDDDYARAVLAQTFAESPKLDPTGSSWLPFPFWMNGAGAALFGTSLDVMRAMAVLQGILGVWLIYAAGRLCLPERREALAAAILAATLPWSARLGLATVPELFTASLCVFAIITMLPSARAWRFLGALALLAATLSRYEAWPVAGCFALWCVYEAVFRGAKRPLMMASAGVGLAGPAAWLLHNAVAHGDALAFAARVSAYRDAFAGPAGRALIAYPKALVLEAPTLCGLALVVSLVCLRRGSFRVGPFRVVVGVCAVLLTTLTLMSLRGGAPTHHPERAVLILWLLAAMYVGALAYRFGQQRAPERHGGMVVIGLIAVMFCLRAGFRGHFEPGVRAPERALGRAIAQHVPPSQKVLLEVVDYGYFATLAASGRPADLVLDRDVDPRHPLHKSAFVSVGAIRERAARTGAKFVAGRPSETTKILGRALYEGAGFALWRVD